MDELDKQIQQMIEKLPKCLKILHRDKHKRVMKKIIALFLKREEATFYRLYEKERVLNSKFGLQKVLNDLVKCGYIEYRVDKAKTNAPRGKKLYYPTPSGLLQMFIISMLEGSPIPFGLDPEDILEK